MGAWIMIPTIKIHNAETNEIIEREMNNEELEAHNLRQIEMQEQVEKMRLKDAEKTALLARLGITEEEAKLLLS
jgi:hypothetical protein